MKLIFKTLILSGLFITMLFSFSQANATIEANDDRYTVFGNSSDNKMDVSKNDTLPASCTNPVIRIIDTSPHTGTAAVTGSVIFYTPAAGETEDILKYSIYCDDEADADTATVYITIAEKPEYISDINCWISPVGQEWAIRQSDSVGLVSTLAQILVGDMNDDGFPDIVAVKGKIPNTEGIKIFYGPDFNTVDSVTGIRPQFHGFGAIGKVKTGEGPDVYENLIFYWDDSTKKLYAIRTDGTSPWLSNPECEKGMIGLADFNGDGWTEVYVGNRIFDAATGKLLADGGSNNSGKAALMGTTSNYMAYSQAVNILGDENLELVAGNQIYNVEIDRAAATPKPLQVISSISPPSDCGQDGVTVVADFNNDGNLEVLVRQRSGGGLTSTTIHMYLWSPHTGTSTGTILAKEKIGHTFFGIPFVGDIDGDGRIEIVALGSNGKVENQYGFRALKYDETGGSFTQFWNVEHKDQSGGTGMTLFDFNMDGIAEIVYCDEQQLRIINGSGKSHITGADTIPYTLNAFKSYSATAFEYPVIVDIFNNGSSAILVTSDTGETRTSASQDNYTYDAYIDIFTSDPSTPWAPARKVWNQYSYNPVNVNEDLTIPRRPLSIATILPGDDGLLGTADDVRPFNNILQQQSTLNKNGTLLWLAPDIVSDPSLQSVSYVGDDVHITLGIVNIGAAVFPSPLHYTVYQNSASFPNIISTHTENALIEEGDTVFVSFVISDAPQYIPFNSFIIRLNDDGTSFPIHQECDVTNNEQIYYPLIYNENTAYPSTDGTLPYPNPLCLLDYEHVQTAGNPGNLQRPPTDSVMFVGWSPTDNCIFIEYPEEEPTDILMPGDTIQIQSSSVNLYVVWAYDRNENGIPDYKELQIRVKPAHLWPLKENDPAKPDWNRAYEDADASWYTGCEMDLILTVSPSLVSPRIVLMDYLGAFGKEYFTDLDGNPLADTFTFETGQGKIVQRFVIKEIPDSMEGEKAAIGGKLQGGNDDMTKWNALYNHPTYDSVFIKPYYDLKFMLRLDITGGSPNLLRSVNGLYWRNAYLPLSWEEQIETTEGVVWLREPNGCWEEEFQFIPPVHPVIQRPVHIPSHPSVTTTPDSGKYYVLGHDDFSFTTLYKDSPLRVMAEGYNSGDIIELAGKRLDDGSYEYTIRQVTEPWTISFEPEDGTGSEGIDGLSVWTYENTLYIRSETEVSVSIYTITGTLYKQIRILEGEQRESLPQGVYFILFDNGKRQKVWIE